MQATTRLQEVKSESTFSARIHTTESPFDINSNRMQVDPNPGVCASPDENNILEWEAVIFGLAHTTTQPLLFGI